LTGSTVWPSPQPTEEEKDRRVGCRRAGRPQRATRAETRRRPSCVRGADGELVRVIAAADAAAEEGRGGRRAGRTEAEGIVGQTLYRSQPSGSGQYFELGKATIFLIFGLVLVLFGESSSPSEHLLPASLQRLSGQKRPEWLGDRNGGGPERGGAKNIHTRTGAGSTSLYTGGPAERKAASQPDASG